MIAPDPHSTSRCSCLSNTITLYRPIGAKELEEFNRHIVGAIEVIAEFREER